MFAPDELSDDGFLGGRLRLKQPRTGYRAAIDAVLLAAACPARPGQAVLELGCGAGVASLCLGQRVSGLKLVGIELQAAYAALARQNATANALDFEVIEADLRAPPAGLRARSFDHVLTNPPYFTPNSGSAASDPGRETAQRETLPLGYWVAAGLRRLKPAGFLTLIQRADRLGEILTALTPAAGSIAVLPLAARLGRPAGRVLVQARKGAKGPLHLLAPFVLHAGEHHETDGEDLTPQARSILRDGAALPIVR
jgi:tRNA1Val (adenine37-N6)-methyltransferase